MIGTFSTATTKTTEAKQKKSRFNDLNPKQTKHGLEKIGRNAHINTSSPHLHRFDCLESIAFYASRSLAMSDAFLFIVLFLFLFRQNHRV